MIIALCRIFGALVAFSPIIIGMIVERVTGSNVKGHITTAILFIVLFVYILTGCHQ